MREGGGEAESENSGYDENPEDNRSKLKKK
jgi:hypothetical protein